MRQTIAPPPLSFMVVSYRQRCSCNALTPLRSAGLWVWHTACSSFSFVTAAPVACGSASFISSSVPLHYTTFAPGHLLPGMGHRWPVHRFLMTVAHIALQQLHRGSIHCRWPCCPCTPLTGFHSASLRHAFSQPSPTVHPLPTFLLALRPTTAAFSGHPYGSFPPFIAPTAAPPLLHSSAACVPSREMYSGGLLWSRHRPISKHRGFPAGHLRGGSPALPFVPLSSALRRLAEAAHALHRLLPGAPPHLPQALFPCRSRLQRLRLPIPVTFAKKISSAVLPHHHLAQKQAEALTGHPPDRSFQH